MEVSDQVASQSITLVKDTQDILPLSVEKHRRVVVVKQEFDRFFPGASMPTVDPLIEGLLAEGFEVREFDQHCLPTAADTDLVLYLIGNEATPTASHVFLDWRKLQGLTRSAMARFWNDIPCLMVSFGQPYFLYDAPGMPAYVNAYTTLAPVQAALLRKLMGRESFTGVSPVDPFCGQDAARY
jgi:beta-N-acetylhexosaminidase